MEGYRYWSNAVVQELGIEGVEGEFLVNLEKRSIINLEGLKYEGKLYYTLSQLPNGLYNVDYEETNVGKPTFESKLEKIATNKWRVTISNIQYGGYISKWKVCYRLNNKDYWNTTEDTSFMITEPGDYEIYIKNDKVESNKQEIETNAKVGKKVTDINKEYTNHGTALIPVGFTIVPGLDNVEEGLVISDSEGDTEQDSNNKIANGNQFVWIPVTDESKYVRNTTYNNSTVSQSAYTDNDYLPGIIQPDVSKAVATEEKTVEQVIGEINEKVEKEQVVSKGGFYIARYEAGIETINEERKVVSKKKANVWTGITQDNAKSTAKTMFLEDNHVKSALISGIQWDMEIGRAHV